ncbi:N-acetylglucosamine kinase [Oceanobacillus bengalensis]|uniref:ATPase BadF/BadG/BcrA/BcrD type domain-containing protein n=1 Tax=Oceanobacillus bengalensis TaxID=1435466 RepID=A0A494YZQ6_9BACI|nr:BadF/BadG/BcrA/BcrD ATPase family protein [Oceanobacillus bengalensis]RKQ15699.1 hypothetical protein D8M05_09330 [Oceanobacillus bengalensis]
MYVIGIDGGGTKTKGVLANSNGEIIAETIVGASNPNSVLDADLRNEIAELFQSLKIQSGELYLKVRRVYAGMSGVGHPTARKDMKELISALVPDSINVTVNHDAITALYSGTLGNAGIVQIAGTGSITLGLGENGVLNRVGGWGYLLGEKGSGYALGSQGLEAAFLAHDGLGDTTELHQLFLDHFQVTSLPDAIQTIYRAKNLKETIAFLSKLVMKAADNGDPVAQKIIHHNAVHMAESISYLCKKMFIVGEAVPVVLTGGLFNRFDLFQDTMELVFLEKQLKVQLIKPEMEPVGGAVIAALKEEGIEIENHFSGKFSNRL